MKIFIGQVVIGENLEKLKQESLEIVNLLNEKGHDAYCTFCEDESFQEKSPGEMLKFAFDKIDEVDCFLAIVRTKRKSEGLLMEIGYAIAKKKKIILMLNKSVKNTYLDEIADKIIEFNDKDDLLNKLKEVA